MSHRSVALCAGIKEATAMHPGFHALERKQGAHFLTVCCRVVVVVTVWQGRRVATTKEVSAQNHRWEIGGAAALGFCISCISVPTDVEVSLPSGLCAL